MKSTIIINMERDDLAAVYRYCAERLITVDELVEEFLNWAVHEPKAFQKWLKENELWLEEKMKKRLFMPEISEEEFLEHLEDDEFFRIYGNPVIIRSTDGKHDCVFVSIEYYDRIQRLRQILEEVDQVSAGIVSEDS